MSLKFKSLEYLDKRNIEYEYKTFDSSAPKGAENVANQFCQDPRIFLKTLIFEDNNGQLFLCLVGGDQKLDEDLLADVIDAKTINMASPDRILEELGYKIGSIPPFGLTKEIPVIIEETIKPLDLVGVGAGQWGHEIFITPENLIEATKGYYAKLVKIYEETDWKSLKLDEKFLPRIQTTEELEKTVYLDDIEKYLGKEIVLSGWIFNLRSSGKIMFLQFRDGTGNIQGIIEKSNVSKEIWEKANELTIESSLQLKGIVKKDERSPFGYEMNVTDLKIIQISPEFPIGKKEHGPDFLMDNRHLWIRTNSQRAILKIRNEIFFSMTSFLRQEKFTRIDTPIFQPVSCEDTSELFEINYFGDKTYLTQSGQLYLEAAEFGLGRTYDFGPVFRAEKSKTRKHLIEFWMMDAELPFTDLKGLMDFEEKMAKRMIADCLTNCKNELKILDRNTENLEKCATEKFIRLPHKEAIDLLNKKYNMELTYLDDIGAPEEAKLAEIYDLPVFLYDWPAEIKAFYMPKFVDEETTAILGKKFERVKAVDLMSAEGFGEIMGGAEREFDHNKLLKVIEEKNYPFKDYKWYMDLRKYGTIPHSGFGIGLERFVRWISGIHHIRETIPFARMLNRMYP